MIDCSPPSFLSFLFFLSDIRRSKAKATIFTGRRRGKVVEEISFNSSDSNRDRSNDNDASFEGDKDSKQGDKNEGLHGNINKNKATPEEFESSVGDVAKRSTSNKGKLSVDKPSLGTIKKIAIPNEVGHDSRPPSCPAESHKADDFVMRLLESLNEMNEDRDILLAKFDLVLTGSPWVVG